MSAKKIELYLCDPLKNVNCKKERCFHTQGGECIHTTNKDFEDDRANKYYYVRLKYMFIDRYLYLHEESGFNTWEIGKNGDVYTRTLFKLEELIGHDVLTGINFHDNSLTTLEESEYEIDLY